MRVQEDHREIEDGESEQELLDDLFEEMWKFHGHGG
jgi:hypothetical protein